jgi:FRG domain
MATFRLANWSAFPDFVEHEVFGATSPGDAFVWRGQRRETWPLDTSLDRLFDRLGLAELPAATRERVSNVHLQRFMFAARGRRGVNPPALADNAWWALGQHYGLATPLLDWSRSPFAALYFAFEETDEAPTDHRVVFGLNERAVQRKNRAIDDGPAIDSGRVPFLEFIDPLTDENPRLVSQGGVFTRAPLGMPIERWVAQAFDGSAETALLRVEVPSDDRMACLRALGRMNISHLSLFPDLNGASRSSNLALELNPRG